MDIPIPKKDKFCAVTVA